MTTLHRVTEFTKKFLLGFSLGVCGIILLVIAVRFIQSLFPKKVDPPTVTFGVLPAIQFPSNSITRNFTYTNNTLSGKFPILADRVAVYKFSQPTISLLSLNQAKDLISRNNMPIDPTQLSSTLYQWQQIIPPFAKISYDIVTNNFTFTTNYLSDPNVLIAPNLPDQTGAISSARGFFDNFAADFTDIDMSKTQTTLYSINNGILLPATSISNTQAIRVDFFQQDIDKIPMYTPRYPHSPIYAIVASVDYPNLIAEGGYFHQKILTDQNGTYPLKTVDEAYTELTGNKAYIANYDGIQNNILIQNAYLAYLAPDSPQQYLMPVIVFQGNDNFYAYVSAIQDRWVK